MRALVDHLFHEGWLLMWGPPATGVLVETLGAQGDVAEAEAAIERFAAAPADEGLVIREIWLFRLRALRARAHGDETAYRDYRDRYRDMATLLGLEGHIAWADAVPLVTRRRPDGTVAGINDETIPVAEYGFLAQPPRRGHSSCALYVHDASGGS
jgi:hypothetical protein